MNKMNIPDAFYFVLLCLLLLVVLAATLAVAGFILVRFIDRKFRSCPECGSKSTGVIVGTEIQHLKTYVDHTGRSPMRLKLEKVTDNYQCESCGYTWTRTFERKTDLDLKARSEEKDIESGRDGGV